MQRSATIFILGGRTQLMAHFVVTTSACTITCRFYKASLRLT